MNPDQEFDSVEREYRRITPAQPSERLRRRLESVVSMTPPAPSSTSKTTENIIRPPRGIWASPWFQTAAAALVGAAAVLAFFKVNPATPELTSNPDPSAEIESTPGPIEPTFPFRPAATPVSSDGFRLTGHENRVFNTQDDGIVFSRDEVPFRRVRYNAVDRRVFIDPKTGTVVEFVVPREDVLIVPAETF